MTLKLSVLSIIIVVISCLSADIHANSVIDIESLDSTNEESSSDQNDSDILTNNTSPFSVFDNAQAELKNCAGGKIIALNKITATSKELTLKLGSSIFFGNIDIKLHKCVKNLDPYAENNYLLLTVTEYKIDEDPKIVFQGWLVSSSISLSTFEHPIYEIFAKDCL